MRIWIHAETRTCGYNHTHDFGGRHSTERPCLSSSLGQQQQQQRQQQQQQQKQQQPPKADSECYVWARKATDAAGKGNDGEGCLCNANGVLNSLASCPFYNNSACWLTSGGSTTKWCQFHHTDTPAKTTGNVSSLSDALKTHVALTGI
jgi:hypothetical protein